MRQKIKKFLFGSFISALILSQSSLAFASQDLSAYILDPMPGWYKERYTRGHLDIGKMMKDGFSRIEAIEIQNQMKDLLDNEPAYAELEKEGKTIELLKKKDEQILKNLRIAIDNVKNKKVFESGFKPEKLKENEFYIVFDLDETLLVQWYEAGLLGKDFYDIKVPTIDNILRPVITSPNYVSLTPGFEWALKEISAIPGCKGVIFFSAKLDTATHSIVDRMTINGKPIKSFIKGLFTRNYLIREEEPTKLAKDLRIFDESLKSVIIIDDNPTRILEKQKKNLREIPKYNPDEYLKAKNITKDKKITAFFENLLPVVVSEIKEAAEYSKAHKTPFAEAYYPYTADAQSEVLMLQKQGHSLKESIEMVRKNPKFFEPKSFP